MVRDDEARAAIVGLQLMLRNMIQDGLASEPTCPLAHCFAPGAYARSILIPKGTLLVGKIHRHAHLNMLMHGTVSLATEEGPAVLQSPKVMVSKAGTKRVVFAHTDVIWTTVHLTEQTDLARIEDEIIVKTYEDFDAIQDADVLQLLPHLRREEGL
jgi:hypothetical protein